MMKYRVSWYLDLDDEDVISPLDAARVARKHQSDPDTIATCFVVTDTSNPVGTSTHIDLMDYD